MRESRDKTALRRRSVGAALLLAAIAAVVARAHPPRAGAEFQVNSYTTGFQTARDVAMNGDGDFVVVWQSDLTGFDQEVFGQRFDAEGVPQGGEFRVNTVTLSNQGYSAVTMHDDGAFVVSWYTDADQDGSSLAVMAQRFSSAGARIGKEFVVNTLTTSIQWRPAITADGKGGFFVVWEDNGRGGSFPAISGRFFDSAGSPLGPDFQVNTYSSGQSHADIAVNGSGDFLVAWASDNQDGSGEGIFGQRFASSGGRIGVEFQINAYTPGRQLIDAAAAIGDEFVVVWSSRDQDGDAYGIFGRRVVDGAPQANEFQVPSSTVSLQFLPDIAADASGDFVVTWQSYGQDGSLTGIFAQRFDSNGAPEGPEFQVNERTMLGQTWPSVAVDENGGMVVVWTGVDGDRGGVFAQRFGDLIPFDVDRNGSFGPLTDGLLLLRYGFGFRGQALVAGAVDLQGCNRCSAEAIEAFIESLGPALDVDGDGQFSPLTDGLLALRFAFGLRGASLTTDAVGAGCTRCTAQAIKDYLTAWAD